MDLFKLYERIFILNLFLVRHFKQKKSGYCRQVVCVRIGYGFRCFLGIHTSHIMSMVSIIDYMYINLLVICLLSKLESISKEQNTHFYLVTGLVLIRNSIQIHLAAKFIDLKVCTSFLRHQTYLNDHVKELLNSV